MKTKLFFATVLVVTFFTSSILQSQTIVKTSFYSQALQKNNNVNIFLPSCYDADSTDYPVIYYLHGWGGNENSASLVMQLAETYINNGTIEPVIIVCANNRPSPLLGSFYVNSELNGNYEDYNTQDLISWVETNYRAKSGRNNRSLMGQSMGGYGSFRYGILHKDLYRGIAAHGSAINYDLVINDILVELKNENAPGPPYSYDFANGHFTKMVFAMSGAFAPNEESGQTYISPAIVEFPMDENGSIIDSIYQKYLNNDPVTYINTLLPSDSVAILFGAGRNDNLHLFQSSFSFKDTLESYGLEYEYVDHYGTHAMPAVFRERALIFLDSILDEPVYQEICLAPSEITIDNVTNNSATLSWTENGTATTWDIRLGEMGFDTTGFTPTTVTSNPYTITGLLSETNYDFYVRSSYENGDLSSWTGPYSFTTESLINISQPIGLWALDGTSGTTVIDGSGNNLHGVLINGTQWDENGKIGGAISCDGVNDYVEIPDNDLLDPGSNDFTVSLWVYKRVSSRSWDNIWGVNKWNTGAAPGTNEWALGIGAGGRTDQPSFGIQSGTISYSTKSDKNISLNQWHLITGVREGSQIKLYVDGVLEGTQSVGDISVNNAGRNIRIANSQMNNYYTDGMFDDLRIYDRALSASEILALTQSVNGAPLVDAGPDQCIILPIESTILSATATDDGLPSDCTLSTTWSKVSGPGNVIFGDSSILCTTAAFTLAGNYQLKLLANDGLLTSTDTLSVLVSEESSEGTAPIGYWALDGTSGTTAIDGSGNNLHGLLVNGTQWDVNGKIGGAISCDGINDYVEIPDNDLLDPGSNDFTVSLWVYKRVSSWSWDNIWGVNKWNTGAAPGTNEWALGLGAGGYTDRPSFGIQSGSTSYGASSAKDISLNQWHLITGVREGSQIKLYVDGVLEGTQSVGDVSVNNAGRNIRIANSQMNNYYTDGMFDDLRIYDRALSASEILALTQAEPYVSNAVHDNIDINDGGLVIEPKISEFVYQNNNHLTMKDDNIIVYAINDYLVIKSSGEALNEHKEVYVYDFFGQLNSRTKIPPTSLVKIPVGNCGCYKIIKVLSNNSVSTFKVFVK